MTQGVRAAGAVTRTAAPTEALVTVKGSESRIRVQAHQ